MFRRHEVERTYLALARGVPKHERFLVEAPLQRDRARIRVRESTGRPAATEAVVAERFRRATLMEVHPRTGRTHQIRVHMASLGHPVVGDRTYGRSRGKHPIASDGLALHAVTLAFMHPISQKRVEFAAAFPPRFERLLSQIRNTDR